MIKRTAKSHGLPNSVDWDLEQVLPIAEFDSTYNQLESDLDKYKTWLKQMTPDMAEAVFQEYFAWHFEFQSKLARLADRAVLWEVTDGKAGQPALLKTRAQDLMVKALEVMRPISMWLKGKPVDGLKILDDINAKRLFSSIDGMEYALTYARIMAKHTLAIAEEDIISHKDSTGSSVLTDLREMIETDFTFDLVAGDKTEHFETSEELRANVYSPDPIRRQATYQALFKPYIDNSDKFYKIYQSIVKDWAYEAKLRGYQSPIAMRNAANQVTDAAIESLMRVCEANVGVFQEFFKWKAQRMGIPKLTRFDLYAPLSESKSNYSYPDAVAMVLETFDGFSKDFANRARRIIDEQHIDSHPRKNKRSGAFCMTITPDLAPYVMLNFAGKSRDVSTLAHELGHGVHSLYADKLPIGSQHANLPLSETASTFGEMILFENMLSKITDNDERQVLLADKIADSYATICRQTFFVKFEIEAHKVIPEGAGLKDIQKLWLDGLHQQFGDSIEIDEIFKNEWAYIPHIVYTPFYCYAYNFGDLLSLSLYARFKAEGQSFVPKIEAILAAGGSREPKVVLAEVGIDMESDEFWSGGFEIIKGWVKELHGGKAND